MIILTRKQAAEKFKQAQRLRKTHKEGGEEFKETAQHKVARLEKEVKDRFRQIANNFLGVK